MGKLLCSIILIFSFSCTQSQVKEKTARIVGGPCEVCEAVLEYGDRKLNPVDTLPGFIEQSPKLKITGTVYQKEGQIPAKDVILYIYHTNRVGIYEKQGDEVGWAKFHGVYRGWIKTGADGKYTFYTFRPAAYPGGGEPEHIHIIVKEPNKNEYYIEDFYFDNDPLLTETERRSFKKRGGSGIVKPELQNGIATVKRNIILGLNIPDYY